MTKDQSDLLRKPFPANQISKLPKPSKAQTDSVKADFRAGIRCKICGAWHHPDVIHLDYVGHAASTDRILDVDPCWTWEPLTSAELACLPPAGNGMWIRLTIAGVSRIGYGCADGKTGGDAIKECIGDAIRNAFMRFGGALDLWHKGTLHQDEDETPQEKPAEKPDLVAQSIAAFRQVMEFPSIERWGKFLLKMQGYEEKMFPKLNDVQRANVAKTISEIALGIASDNLAAWEDTASLADYWTAGKPDWFAHLTVADQKILTNTYQSLLDTVQPGKRMEI